MTIESRFGDLRRGPLFRVVTTYAVAAWFLAQFVDVTFPVFRLGGGVQRAAFVLIGLGFPAVIAFSLYRRRPPSPRRARRGAVAAGALGFMLVSGIAMAVWGGSATQKLAGVDAELVVVPPFRATGPQTHELGAGLPDLFFAKLTGEGGLRAIDPRLVDRRLKGSNEAIDLAPDEAVELARGLGAGWVLLGSITGTGTRVVLNARLLDVPAGRAHAQADVEGPLDSLTYLVDRAAVALLSLRAGNATHLATLTSHSTDAVLPYLAGQAAMRRGAFHEAYRNFVRALEVDTTFALAALNARIAAGWITVPSGRFLEIAWAGRDKLSARDHADLLAVVGPRYPEATPIHEWIAALDAAIRLNPDRAHLHYELGDWLYHHGSMIQRANAMPDAEAAFDRALALDSTYGPALFHRVELAIDEGDTATIRELARRLNAVGGGTGEAALLANFAMTFLMNDEQARERLYSLTPDSAVVPYTALTALSLTAGLGFADTMAASILPQRDAPLLGLQAGYFMARGQISKANGLLRELRPVRANRRTADHLAISFALYDGGDSAAAAQAAAELERALATPTVTADDEENRAFDLCVLEQWRISAGNLESAPSSIQWLSSRPLTTWGGYPGTPGGPAHYCALLLDAMLAEKANAPDVERRMQRLDSALVHMRGGFSLDYHAGLLQLALYYGQRDPEAGLRHIDRQIQPRQMMKARLLLEEGRLAERANQRVRAIDAYSRYLRLRDGADAALQPEIEQVRQALAALVGERRP